MLLLVFHKNNLSQEPTHLDLNYIKNGVGYMGNKGAVYISFKLSETQFCFINCHLAAYQNGEQRRLLDYYSIIRSMRQQNGLEMSWQSGFCFWFGDLNFRVNRKSRYYQYLLSRQFRKLKNWTTTICCPAANCTPSSLPT